MKVNREGDERDLFLYLLNTNITPEDAMKIEIIDDIIGL